MSSKSIYFFSPLPNILFESEIRFKLSSWMDGKISRKFQPYCIQISELFECTEDQVFALGKELNQLIKPLHPITINAKEVFSNPIHEEFNLKIATNDQLEELYQLICSKLRENRTIQRTPQFNFFEEFQLALIKKGDLNAPFQEIHSRLISKFSPFSYTQDTLSLMEFNGEIWQEKFFFPLEGGTLKSNSIALNTSK
ncbi:MAG: hypothetical protein ACKO8Q_08165 [Bacteroidota bacterium]